MAERYKQEQCIDNLVQQIGWIEDCDAHKFPGWGHTVNAMRQAIALLKAQEPISVKHIHTEYPEHIWRKDENGEIDEWAMEYEYHQGPVCERCGDSFCIHCEPDGYETHRKCVIDRYECPTCGYMLWKNQKYCNNCGQAVKWDG